MLQKDKTQVEILENDFITDLASFFDLLADFDYQDKQKKLGIKNNKEK